MKIANLETAHFSVNFSRRNFEAFDSRPFTRGQHIITVDGKNPAETPVEVGTLSHYLQGFVHPRCNSMLQIMFPKDPLRSVWIESGIFFDLGMDQNTKMFQTTSNHHLVLIIPIRILWY